MPGQALMPKTTIFKMLLIHITYYLVILCVYLNEHFYKEKCLGIIIVMADITGPATI